MLQEFIKSISIVLYEALCSHIFLGAILQDKITSRIKKTIAVLALAAVFMGCALSTQILDQYFLRSFVIILSIFVYAIIMYEGKWMKKLFIGAVFYGLMVCVDYLCLIFIELFVAEDLLKNPVFLVIIVLLCKTILFLFVLLLDFTWKEERKVEVNTSEWILLLVFPFLTVAIMVVMLMSFREKSSYASYLTVSIGMVIVNIVMFGLMRYVSAREQKMKQIQILQERNRERINAYQEMNIDYQNQKRILHDYSNQIHCIYGLLQSRKYQDAQEYATKLVGYMEENMEIIDVKNAILNVVLNQKYRTARNQNISIIFQINNLTNIWIEDTDMVIIMSNLLDNAIEACRKLKENKVIRLKIVREKMQLVLSVQNPVANPVEINQKQLKTSKGDKKNHGIGLKNVQMVLEKYKGFGNIYYRDGWVYYTAIIPKKEEI